MVHEPTVKDPDGKPVQGVLVTVNNEMTGESIIRTTDGNGYANCSFPGNWAPEHRVSIAYQDLTLRCQGVGFGDKFTVPEAARKVEVVLPFA